MENRAVSPDGMQQKEPIIFEACFHFMHKRDIVFISHMFEHTY